MRDVDVSLPEEAPLHTVPTEDWDCVGNFNVYAEPHSDCFLELRGKTKAERWDAGQFVPLDFVMPGEKRIILVPCGTKRDACGEDLECPCERPSKDGGAWAPRRSPLPPLLDR